MPQLFGSVYLSAGGSILGSVVAQRPSVLACGGCEGRSTAPLHSRPVRCDELNFRSSTPTFGSTTKLQHIHLRHPIHNRANRKAPWVRIPSSPLLGRSDPGHRTYVSFIGVFIAEALCTSVHLNTYDLVSCCGLRHVVFRKKVIHGLGYQVLHALLGVLGLYQFERRSCLYGKPGANHYSTLAGGPLRAGGCGRSLVTAASGSPMACCLRAVARKLGFGLLIVCTCVVV